MILVSGKDKCPHILRRWVVDEFMDFCEVEAKVCRVWGGFECERWEDINQEWAEEVKDGQG